MVMTRWAWLPLALGMLLGDLALTSAPLVPPRIVAEASAVQVGHGAQVMFTITATFLDGDGAFYAIEVDEQELPDGFAVVDTGDTVVRAPASDGQLSRKIASRTRFYKLRAIEPGVWVLPSAKLKPTTSSAQGAVQQTSPIYTIISASAAASTMTPSAKGGARPFFKLLPAKAATSPDGKPLAYHQISGLFPDWRSVPWKVAAWLVAVLGFVLALVGLYRSSRATTAHPVAEETPATIAQLRQTLEEAAYRDRYPHEIDEGFDTIQSVLIRYAQQFLNKDIGAILPADIIAEAGFIDGAQRLHIMEALSACYDVRFRQGAVLEDRARLAAAVTAALAAIIEPAPDAQTGEEGAS